LHVVGQSNQSSADLSRLAPPLRERRFQFVGLGHNIAVINVTSPTGIRAVKNVGGPDIAALIWDKIEAMRRRAKK